jgi:hypothetical protein
MNTKLTLTIDRSVIQSAKKYAGETGRSLSDLVENYFRMLTSDQEPPEKPLPPVTSSLKGALKAPDDFDYKEALVRSLVKKYLDKDQ